MPEAFLETATETSPSWSSWVTFDACVSPPSTAELKNVYRPAVELRPKAAIGDVRPEPGKALHSVTLAVKMSLTSETLRSLSRLDGLTEIVSASRKSLE